jgi:two-component system sensor histidine kinase TctE
MSVRWSRSLQFRLALRLALVYLAATAVVIAALVYRAYDVADALNSRELDQRASDLARAVVLDDTGAPRLDLPPPLAAAYASSAGSDVFAIRTADGRTIAAEPRSFSARVADWPLASNEPSWFRLDEDGAASREYYGLSIAEDSAAGPLSISVAQSGGAHAMVESVISEFVFDTAWIIPILVALTLGAGVLAIRSGLAPVIRASQIAAQIGPSATAVRLPEQDIPKEIAPLVIAMNRALDRLDKGFATQRAFTANAAHELRTPLAILTAALDGMGPSEEIAKLKGDVARMNRLVEQLLRVARLDALALDVSGSVDLNETAESVVAAMAPRAIALHRPISLIGADGTVTVKGNMHAIEDALRNLIENALAHSPENTEIAVRVESSGSVSVADQGQGVRLEDREQIFERFWRGENAKAGGAGLGLAIVLEIMKAHGGHVAIADNPGGGAVLSLVFPPTKERQ